MLSEDIINKIYAGWLGKLIGIRSGAPIEMWSSEQIKEKYGKLDGYIKQYSVFPADDDSNVPTLWLNTMYNHKDVTKLEGADFANSLLNLVSFERGMFWWGGYGVSEEHTAYLNLKSGIPAPFSGSAAINSELMAEQIGGQIFIDVIGQVNPGNTHSAARLASIVASVTHDGNGVYGGMFIAAAVAAAFKEKNILKVIQCALAEIPYDSTYAKMVEDIINFHENDKSQDYESCLNYVKKYYWKDKFGGNCHIIPNAAIVVLSLLYGQNSFDNAINISNRCGFDTDCNSANVGCIMGTFLGLNGIDYEKWRKPINDTFVCSSALGTYNIIDVPTLALKTADVAARMNFDLTSNLAKENRFTFRFSGSTCGFSSMSSSVKVENLGNNRLTVSGGGMISRKTYFRASEFDSDNYSPCFSPIVYAGQTISMKAKSQNGTSIQLYALDANSGEVFRGALIRLGNTENVYSYKIEGRSGVLISEIGLELLDSDGKIEISEIAVTGQPQYVWDFSKERIESFQLTHNEVSQSTHNKGFWRLENDVLVGSCADDGEIFSGHTSFNGCDYSIALTPVVGENHLFLFNVLGIEKYFAFGFYGKNKVALIERDGKCELLSEVKFNWENKEKYIFKLETSNNKIVGYINEREVLRHEISTHKNNGQFGFKIEKGSRINIEYIKIN